MENMNMKRIVMIIVAGAAIFMAIRYYQSHHGQDSVKVQYTTNGSIYKCPPGKPCPE